MTRFDTVERLGASTVQHGPANARVYLMRLDAGDLPDLPRRLIDFASNRGYGKVFAKVPRRHTGVFLADGYEIEAAVPGYYQGREDACFAVFYVEQARRDGDRSEAERIRERACARPAAAPPADAPAEPPGIRRLGPEDAEEAARVYRSVFETYPFPIHDPDYLRRTLAADVAYYGVRQEGSLAALASAEMDRAAGAAELTDFATVPSARGRGWAGALLERMGRDLAREGFCTGYTIARALSPGMNTVFARAGYRFGGMLWNNTQICGRLEPMNVWHRALGPCAQAPDGGG